MADVPASIQKTPEEIQEMSPAERKAYDAAQARAVFGHDHHKDGKGRPVEQGLGSPGHETHNHFAALRKHEGEESYWEAVADLWKREPKRAKALNLPQPKPKQERDAAYLAAAADMWKRDPKMAETLGLPRPS